MKAVGLREFGGPEVLEVLDLEDPEPAAGQILIRVRAAAVNPTDTVLRSGGRYSSRKILPPHVPGMDAAGEVTAIGEAAETDLGAGDRVMAIVVPNGQHGAYAQLVAVAARSVGRMPRGASFAEAATLPMNGLTALKAIEMSGVGPEGVLAVTGAAGTLGGYTVQLAKAAGIRVVADAAPRDEQLVRGLGADEIVARGQDVGARIRELVPEGVDGLIDAAVLDAAVAAAVKEGGVVATVRGFEGPGERGISFRPVWVREWAERWDQLDHLRELAERGAVTLRVARTFPMHEAAEAHRLLESGGVRGRLVIEL